MAAGWHTLELTTTFAQPTDLVALEWQPAWAEQWAKIPRNFLDTHPETHGLLGRYFGRVIDADMPSEIPDAPGYSQIDAVLSFDWYEEIDDPSPPFFAARPSTMEWVGSVDLPEGTDQTLRLEATGPTQVFIDQTLVLSDAGHREGAPPEATLHGLSGRVPILVRTTRPEDDHRTSWKLRLLWRDAGDGWTAFVRYHPPGDDAVTGVE